jgi:rhodanese-related sulfurtransferase
MLCLLIAGLELGASATAVLTIDNPSYDFGEVLAGQVVTHTYTLSNTGDVTLLITRVQATCGCTVPSWETATLEPGSSIPLEATFSTAGYSGRVIKTVYVHHRGENETATQTVTLSLSGLVRRAEPYDLAAGELERVFILLIDLRNAGQYTRGHLIGALSIPFADLANWVGVLPRDVFMVLYDQDGTISPLAAETLGQVGYPDVQPLQGGLNAWTQAYGNRFVATGPALPERFLLVAQAAASGEFSVLRPVDATYLNQELLVLVDLRSPEAYSATHLAGAVSVQPADLSEWVRGVPRGTQLVLCDEDGSVARPQAVALCDAGFKTAQALFGGLAEWRASFGERLLVTTIP